MSRFLLLLCAMTAASPSAARTVKGPEQSWGKPGVSLTQYRADSLECASAVHNADISGSTQAKEFANASNRIESLLLSGGNPLDIPNDVQRQVERLRPQHKVNELRTLMNEELARCLTERGYRQFRLTEEQRNRTSELAIGSDERRGYLHALASDPAILAAQGI